MSHSLRHDDNDDDRKATKHIRMMCVMCVAFCEYIVLKFRRCGNCVNRYYVDAPAEIILIFTMMRQKKKK